MTSKVTVQKLLIDLSIWVLSVIVLTESPLSVTKQVCGRLEKLGLNVLPARSMLGLEPNKRELYLNVNGISGLFPEFNPHIVEELRTSFGRRCAMVGYEFLDGDSICASNIGISVADATDSTKSESDLVLTEHALLSVSSAVQISQDLPDDERLHGLCCFVKLSMFLVSASFYLYGALIYPVS